MRFQLHFFHISIWTRIHTCLPILNGLFSKVSYRSSTMSRPRAARSNGSVSLPARVIATKSSA